MVSSEDLQPIWRTAPACAYWTLEQGIHGLESRTFPSSPLAVEEVFELLSEEPRSAVDGSATNRICSALTNVEERGASSNGRLTLPAVIACFPGHSAEVTS